MLDISALYAFGGAVVGGLFAFAGTALAALVNGFRQRRARDRDRLERLHTQAVAIQRDWRKVHTMLEESLENGVRLHSDFFIPLPDDFEDMASLTLFYFRDIYPTAIQAAEASAEYVHVASALSKILTGDPRDRPKDLLSLKDQLNEAKTKLNARLTWFQECLRRKVSR